MIKLNINNINIILNTNLNSNDSQVFTNLLSKLKIGEVIDAEILLASKNFIMFQLADGSKIEASTKKDLELNKGDNIKLVLKSKSEGKFILETVVDTKKNSIKAELSKLGLDDNIQNADLLREFKESGIVVNQELIKKTLSFISENKNIQKATAIFGAIENKTIEELTNIQNSLISNEKFADKLKSIIDQMNKIEDPVILKEIRNIIKQENKLDFKESLKLYIKDDLDNMKSEISNQINIKETNNEITNENINKNTDTEKKSTSSKENQHVEDNKILPQTKLNQLEEKIKSFIVENKVNYLNDIDKFDENITKILKDINNMKFDRIDKFENYINSKIEDIQSNAKQIVSDEFKNSIEKKDNLISNDIKMLKEEIKTGFEKLFLHLDNPKKFKEDVLENKVELKKKLEEIDNVLKSTENNEIHELKNIVSNTLNDIKNTDSILNNAFYFQIPVNINNQLSNMDLYIMKNGKGKNKIDINNSTIVISLKTTNLGTVDSIITKKYDKLYLNIKVENDEMVKYIKNYSHEIYLLINGLGYELVDFNVRIKDDSLNLINLKKILSKNQIINNQSLDIKV